MTESDLEKIGVQLPGHKKKLLYHCEKLKTLVQDYEKTREEVLKQKMKENISLLPMQKKKSLAIISEFKNLKEKKKIYIRSVVTMTIFNIKNPNLREKLNIKTADDLDIHNLMEINYDTQKKHQIQFYYFLERLFASSQKQVLEQKHFKFQSKLKTAFKNLLQYKTLEEKLKSKLKSSEPNTSIVNLDKYNSAIQIENEIIAEISLLILQYLQQHSDNDENQFILQNLISTTKSLYSSSPITSPISRKSKKQRRSNSFIHFGRTNSGFEIDLEKIRNVSSANHNINIPIINHQATFNQDNNKSDDDVSKENNNNNVSSINHDVKAKNFNSKKIVQEQKNNSTCGYLSSYFKFC